MQGALVHKGKNRWALVLSLGFGINKAGRRARLQKWISFHGTKEQAVKALTKLAQDQHDGVRVEPTKRTVGEWLTEWFEKAAMPTMRVQTLAVYRSVINGSLIPSLGEIRLQELKPLDVQQYYADHASTLSPATLNLHRGVLSSALKSALKNGLVIRNVATLADGKPRVKRQADDVAANVLDVDEARRLLAAAKAAGPRAAAFYGLALDTGMRVGELCGLVWTDLDTGKVSVKRQLISATLRADGSVHFGPPKTKSSTRTIDLGTATVALLQAHKRHQAELKMANRLTYADVGLGFAKEHTDILGKHATLGTPIQKKNIGTVEFTKLLTAANVKRITLHGLRHTSATLLLLGGESVKVVPERLGHSKVGMTLDVYSHVLPTMGRAAADRLGALLHG